MFSCLPAAAKPSRSFAARGGLQCQVSFRVGGVFSLARPDGSVDLVVQDDGETMALSATGALLPSVISLPASQSDHVRLAGTVTVTLAKDRAVGMLQLALQHHPQQGGLEEIEAAYSESPDGTLLVGFPIGFSGPVVLQAKSPASTSQPALTRCEGGERCTALPTNIVGAIPLQME
jgi:hypothetical protein